MRSLVVVVAAAVTVGPFSPLGRTARAADPPPVTTSGGVVAADHEAAAAAGARVLAAGGNAVDAAVATALAVGVVNPASSGIGGGGFALVYLAREGKVHAIDFREVAPDAAAPGLYPDRDLAGSGGLAVAVPGELRGLELLIDTWGTRSWRRAVTPAIRLARDGFTVSRFLARASARTADGDRDGPVFAALNAWIGDGFTEGATLTRPALAATLQAIAAGGAAAFYAGSIADDVVATVRAAGGVLTSADLAAYRPIEREPLWGEWRGYRIATMPLPSSGGVVLLEALGILDASGIDLAALGAGSAALLHVLSEALSHAFADRARLLGDDAGSAAVLPRLLDRARLAELAGRIDPDRVQPHDAYGGGIAVPGTRTVDDGGTSHLCVIDRDGNAVALTTTVNSYFGAGLVTDGGVVLNNQIDDFTLASGEPNGFGLVQSDENLVGGGKRPLSSMSPTLVFDTSGKVVACVGGSGGPRIISATLQVLVGALALGRDAAQAVGAPRIHQQWTPAQITAQLDLAPDVIKALEAKGHTVKVTQSGEASVVQLIRVRDDGVREAASDPRKGGRPATAEPEPQRR
jgi:gamma-glutamyltranspeptidase / glutathione hydrolase